MIAELLTGSAVTFISGLTGFLFGRVHRRTTSSNPEPICHCTHYIGDHEEMTGMCHGQLSRTGNGVKVWVDCPCLHYSGPELISVMTMRELSTRPITEES